MRFCTKAACVACSLALGAGMLAGCGVQEHRGPAGGGEGAKASIAVPQGSLVAVVAKDGSAVDMASWAQGDAAKTLDPGVLGVGAGAPGELVEQARAAQGGYESMKAAFEAAEDAGEAQGALDVALVEDGALDLDGVPVGEYTAVVLACSDGTCGATAELKVASSGEDLRASAQGDQIAERGHVVDVGEGSAVIVVEGPEDSMVRVVRASTSDRGDATLDAGWSALALADGVGECSVKGVPAGTYAVYALDGGSAPKARAVVEVASDSAGALVELDESAESVKKAEAELTAVRGELTVAGASVNGEAEGSGSASVTATGATAGDNVSVTPIGKADERGRTVTGQLSDALTFDAEGMSPGWYGVLVTKQGGAVLGTAVFQSADDGGRAVAKVDCGGGVKGGTVPVPDPKTNGYGGMSW